MFTLRHVTSSDLSEHLIPFSITRISPLGLNPALCLQTVKKQVELSSNLAEYAIP
jgi:hypothetical protein